MSTQYARPWPAIDVVEPRYGLAFGSSVEEIADFLQRADYETRRLQIALAMIKQEIELIRLLTETHRLRADQPLAITR
jgi:hypothetical protein